MNIFFLHPTFPAQFLNIATYLASNPDNKVYFWAASNPANIQIEGVTLEIYQKSDKLSELTESAKTLWPLSRMVNPITCGMAIYETLRQFYRDKKPRPDIIIGQAGCGSTLYCKDLYPNVPVIGYFEWYQRIEDTSADYLDANKRLGRISNRTHHLTKLMSLDLCDAAVTATQFQYLRYPEVYKPKFHVIHEGIDTKFCSPDPSGKRPSLVLDDAQLNLPEGTEIITFVSENLEPLRGFPQFMDAIRIVLDNRSNTHVVVVGKDKISKDTSAIKDEKTKGGYPIDRVHFVGNRNGEDYRKILRASSCHVYLTRPFVLSRSCLEAMSFACPIVGSNTAPVQEVISDDTNGLIADFSSPRHIARKIEELLDDPELAGKLGAAARETVLKRFELRKCNGAWEDLIFSLFR